MDWLQVLAIFLAPLLFIVPLAIKFRAERLAYWENMKAEMENVNANPN